MARRAREYLEEEGGVLEVGPQRCSSSTKAQLVREICAAGSIFASCTHRGRRPSRPTPLFVDWYLLLRVDVDEKVDLIRKRYRQLALQLHPDKNKHPSADVAFKLVSEAYSCLSDKAKRKAFNSERNLHFCNECYSAKSFCDYGDSCGRRPKHCSEPTRQASGAAESWMLSGLRQLQRRFRDECEVIEGCLRANRVYWGDESPVFSPSEQAMASPAYPHCRGEAFERRRRTSHPGRVNRSLAGESGGGREGAPPCESPIYEIGKKNHSKTRNFFSRF